MPLFPENSIQIGKTNANTATIAPFGAHLLSWKQNDEEVLFVSKKSIFDGETPIRGGVPLVFPQFGKLGELPQHGFARTQNWELLHSNENQVLFKLSPTILSRELWVHNFEAYLQIDRDKDLCITLKINNTGTESFEFMAALHTYFRVGNIERVMVKGLQGLTYMDGIDGFARKQELSRALTIESEVDRVYLNSQKQEIADLLLGRTISIESKGFKDAVLWNPWVEKSKLIVDFDDEEYREMLCVEAAAIEHPIELAAGAVWQGSQTITVASL